MAVFKAPGREGLNVAWRALFLGDDGQPHLHGRAVLEDLARQAFIHETIARADLAATYAAEGRRQLYLTILQRLGLQLQAAATHAEPIAPFHALTISEDDSA